MVKVAITGASGLVGSRVVELLKNDFEFIPLKQEEGFDLTKKEVVSKTLENMDFEYFLHFAAYTDVNGAEKAKELVYKINVDGTKNVFEEAKKKGAKFIYISTDFVFNGTSSEVIFDENSTPNPVGVYGTSKLEGEKIVGNDGMIVRLSFPYRSSFEPKKDIVRTIKGLLEQGRELKMITDSLITYTFIDDIAYGLKHLLNNFSPEIYHLVGNGYHQPFEMGKMVAKTFGFDENLIRPTTFKEYFGEFSSTRPQYTPTISKKNDFQPMKTLQEGLEELKKA